MIFRTAMVALALVAVTHAPAEAQDAERLALAREVVAVSDGGDLSMQMMNTMRPAMTASLRQRGVDEAAAERFTEMFVQEYQAQIPRILELGALAYADAFTAQELRDLRDFYRSESGQAFRAKAPTVMQAMTQAGMLIGEEIALAVAQRIQQEGARGPDRP